jgi:hypothetical protein
MQERFPGVTIQHPTGPERSKKEPNTPSTVSIKPLGLKRAFFELDKAEVTERPELETMIQQQYPWALIESHGSNRVSNLEHDNDTDSTFTDLCDEASLPLSPGPVSQKPSLASRITKVGQEEVPELKPDEILTAVADDIRLEYGSFDLVTSMCWQWMRSSFVRPYHPQYNLDIYYENLVDLYIVAWAKRWEDFSYALLLRFQETNNKQRSELPPARIAVKAFQFLPLNSPLCRWIHILYAFLWTTETYKAFQEELDYGGMDKNAQIQFLHGVAHFRCPLTPGHDEAVLTRWCNVHTHKPGSEGERQCLKTLESSGFSLDDAKEQERRTELYRAEETIKKYGGHVMMAGNPTVHSTKRKSESHNTTPLTKRGRGRGRGSGR